MTPNQWNRNTRDSVVSLLTQAGFSEDSGVINQLECMNFDAPAEPAQPQSDAVMVPKGLANRLVSIDNHVRQTARRELRNALLGGEA